MNTTNRFTLEFPADLNFQAYTPPGAKKVEIGIDLATGSEQSVTQVQGTSEMLMKWAKLHQGSAIDWRLPLTPEALALSYGEFSSGRTMVVGDVIHYGFLVENDRLTGTVTYHAEEVGPVYRPYQGISKVYAEDYPHIESVLVLVEGKA